MARTARKAKDDEPGEIKPMDFERARSLYLSDIKPAKSEASSQGQTVGEAMKVIKKQCHVEPQGARKAFSAFEMEEAHREIHIRSFVGMFNALMGEKILGCTFGDMVDQMESAEDRYARPKPALVAVPIGTGDETDLADAGDDFEASEDELAAQDGRGNPAKED